MREFAVSPYKPERTITVAKNDLMENKTGTKTYWRSGPEDSFSKALLIFVKFIMTLDHSVEKEGKLVLGYAVLRFWASTKTLTLFLVHCGASFDRV